MESMSGASGDPFEQFLKPPANETPADRTERLKREADAKAVNEAINAQLRRERAQTNKRTVKILLLGQAESGKSTTLKNFRMMFAKDAWDAERASWRAVIHLNIIRSVITIVTALQAEQRGEAAQLPHSPVETRPNSPTMTEPTPNEADEAPSSPVSPSFPLENYERLMSHLPAFIRAYRELQTRLGEGAREEFEDELPGPSSGASRSPGERRQGLSRHDMRGEFCVHRLQEALASAEQASRGERDAPTEVLLDNFDDIQVIWKDEASQRVLTRRHVRLQEMVPPFLDDLARIAQRTYVPTDSDVIRCRLRTVGVQEFKINVGGSSGSIGVNQGKDWLMYDVGGSRTLRPAWVPYFDDVQAIIFLAPISCFDERLAEDSSVNRLEDSFILWRQICSSRLLSNASLILFLNKCDLLKKKLDAGARVERYLPSFAGRSNDINTIVKYLREKFKLYSKDNSRVSRPCYIYPTIVIDTAATAATVSAVKDGILRDYLKYVDLV